MKWYVLVMRVIKLIVLGVGLGCFAFVFSLFVGSAKCGGANAYFSEMTGEELLQMAIYFIILGICVEVAGLIHYVENLAMTLKCTFQVAVFSVVYFMGAYHMGWIEKRGMMHYIWNTLVIAVVSWLVGMAAYGIEIEIINRRIRDKNRNKNN